MSAAAPLRALLLAGSRRGETDAVARAAGVACKALAPVAGVPMVERSLEPLLASPRLGAVEVALPAGIHLAEAAPRLAGWLAKGRVAQVEPADSPARTVADALARVPPGGSLLVATADHALLDAAILERFLDGCAVPEIDAFAALLPLRNLEAKYPGMKRTGLRFRDDRYSGCNLFLLRGGPGARALVMFWTRLEALRKSPVRMAWTVGPLALAAYGLRLLTLEQALRRIGRRAGARVAPVLLDIPEAAIDVDTPRDRAFVEQLLADRRASAPDAAKT